MYVYRFQIRSPWGNSINPLQLPPYHANYRALAKLIYLQSTRVKCRPRIIRVLDTHLDIDWIGKKEMVLLVVPTHSMASKGVQILNCPIRKNSRGFVRIKLLVFNNSDSRIWINPGTSLCNVGSFAMKTF